MCIWLSNYCLSLPLHDDLVVQGKHQSVKIHHLCDPSGGLDLGSCMPCDHTVIWWPWCHWRVMLIQKGLILEVMELGQFNIISHVLNTQFPYLLPLMVFGLVVFILTPPHRKYGIKLKLRACLVFNCGMILFIPHDLWWFYNISWWCKHESDWSWWCPIVMFILVVDVT